MTKKDKILKLFNSIDWVNNEYKTIRYKDFMDAGLHFTIEYGETYNDVIYAQRIFKKMGFRIAIGAAFHIYKQK